MQRFPYGSLGLFLRENGRGGRFENAISGTWVFICGQTAAAMKSEGTFCDKTAFEEGLPGGWRLVGDCAGGWWTLTESHL